MIQHNISILAIQEHTAWNRNLMEYEIKSIEKHCDKWGYVVNISKLQILIIDKQLLACHINTCALKEGHVMVSRFQISHDPFATFIPVCGIPHSKNGKIISLKNMTLTKISSYGRWQKFRTLSRMQLKKHIGQKASYLYLETCKMHLTTLTSFNMVNAESPNTNRLNL